MATITHGNKGRTDVSSRSVPDVKDDAKFGKIKTISAADYYATGSNKGSSGFIVESAGDSVITPTDGDSLTASNLTVKELYEIGVKRVSGSGTVHIVY
jgi:hypothetical protein